jgi:hypothetical protein
MDGSQKVEKHRLGVRRYGIPRRALRNIALLAFCQALTQSSNTLMFASSALAVLTIVSPDMRMWANTPVTMQHLGVMLSVFPASLLMMRLGRKSDSAPVRASACWARPARQSVSASPASR